MESGKMDHSEHAEGAGAAAATQMDSGFATEELRDPHAYAEGEDFGPLGRPRLSDDKGLGVQC
jgi:copper resistance protein B